MYHSAKTCRTRFTDEKLQNLRKNVETLSWAQEKAAQILERADYYLSLGVDHLATLVTSHDVLRSTHVNADIGCPICGKKMLNSGAEWGIDHVQHPWKLKCPSCGSLFPSNDFESFYKSGLDRNGQFSYDLADRTLLVNTLYPDQAADFGVDDGHGWVLDPSDPEHCSFMFIPFYVLQGFWTHREQPYRQNIMMLALKNLTLAYIITGDRKYGNPAAMILLKIAHVYPKMDAMDCPWEKGYRLSHGLSGKGRALGSIWDVLLMEQIVDWYDMLFDCFDDNLTAWLAENPVRYIGDAAPTAQEAIEYADKLLLLIYPDYQAAILNCNPGPPQAMLLKSAVVLNRQDLFDEYAEYIFKHIEKGANSRRMDLDTLMCANVDRDGFADEVACGYNAMWTTGFMEVAELLRGHKYDLFSHVKFRKMGDMIHQYVAADDFSLFIGDCWKTGDRYIRTEIATQVKFFLVTGKVANAQLLAKVAGDGPICTDWFLDCTAIDEKIRAAVKEPFHSQSRLIPCYGLAAIEAHPEGKDPESLSIYFGRNSGHGHRDTMHLNLHGFGLDMMPDLGYPDFTGINAPRYRWNSNMISHNTVTIRQEQPFPIEEAFQELSLHRTNLTPIEGGQIRHFYPGQQVSVIDAEAPKIWNTPFRRTCVVVDTDGKSRYILDLFEAGGKEQHISYHALSTQVKSENITFIPQEGGTYAGPDVPYGDDMYSRLWCDGFNYLDQVFRGEAPAAGFTLDWQMDDNWHLWQQPRDVHMKLHVLSGVQEAALCRGLPPQTKPGNPKAMTYFIGKHQGSTARFAAILEPYENCSFIEKAEYRALEEGAVQLIRVTRKDGTRDLIAVNFTEKPVECSWDSDSFTADAFVTFRSIGEADALLTEIRHGTRILRGKLLDFTQGLQLDNHVLAQLPEDTDGAALVGQYMDIETDVEPNAFFLITSAEQLPDGLWRLGTGDSTFVTGFVDRLNKDLGYRYCVEKGANLTITL